MLKTMSTNKLFTLVILSAVTVMIIITFVFWGIGPRDNPTDTVLAEVEKEKITLDEFWRAYDNEYKRVRETVAGDEEMQKLNLKDRVLEQLVDRKVLIAASEKAGITVTDKELQESIMGTRYFQKNGVFDKAVYEKALRLNRLTPRVYESMLKNDLVINKMTRLIGETTELSPDEIKMIDSLGGVDRGQLVEILRSGKSGASVKAYIEGFKGQLKININRDLIS